jgi:putative cardiolipin synthase
MIRTTRIRQRWASGANRALGGGKRAVGKRTGVLAPIARALRLAVAASAVLMLGACAGIRSDVPRPESFALEDPSQTLLGSAFAAAAALHPGQSGFHLLDTGAEALQARAALADVAERTLDLQYYSVDDDHSTDLLLLHVADAGRRGVRVRILLDDFHTDNREFAERALALVPGVEVRLFNPFLTAVRFDAGRLLEIVGDGERLNRRMHNKLWMADNAAAIVGGRNLGNAYFDADAEQNFSDVDVLAVGPVLDKLSQCFDEYWNSSAAVPYAALAATGTGAAASLRARTALEARLSGVEGSPYERWLSTSDLPRALRSGTLSLHWGAARAGCDQPDKPANETSEDIFHTWLDAAGQPVPTRWELVVVSPYFIPSLHARDHLEEMHSRGVRVAVLTNSLAATDSPAAHAGYARHRADILRRGVNLFELRPQADTAHPTRHRWRKKTPATLHAKMVIADRSRVIVGSINQDPRSRLHNTEIWVAIESVPLARRMAALFDESTLRDHAYRVLLRDGNAGDDALVWVTEDKGIEVRHDSEPEVEWWMRLWMTILSGLVPEHLL